MSYEPTTWKSGDTVTSAKLNKIENGLAAVSGGGSGILAVTGIDDGEGNITLDKTWNEINNASFAVISLTSTEYKAILPICQVYISGGMYFIFCLSPIGGNTFITESADGYPVYSAK